MQKRVKFYRYTRVDRTFVVIFPIVKLSQRYFVVHHVSPQHWTTMRRVTQGWWHSFVLSLINDVKWITFYRLHFHVVLLGYSDYSVVMDPSDVTLIRRTLRIDLPYRISLFLTLSRCLIYGMLVMYVKIVVCVSQPLLLVPDHPHHVPNHLIFLYIYEMMIIYYDQLHLNSLTLIMVHEMREYPTK